MNDFVTNNFFRLRMNFKRKIPSKKRNLRRPINHNSRSSNERPDIDNSSGGGFAGRFTVLQVLRSSFVRAVCKLQPFPVNKGLLRLSLGDRERLRSVRRRWIVILTLFVADYRWIDFGIIRTLNSPNYHHAHITRVTVCTWRDAQRRV